MNIDYAFCRALKNTGAEGAPCCIVVYDVNCQYFKNFQKWVQESPFLEVHPGLIIIPGIGLSHVHRHQLVCLARFLLTFIVGAGQSDGEILETLSSTLNHVGRISWTMTLAHQTEVLDAHMGDNNWKKLVNMGEATNLRIFLSSDSPSELHRFVEDGSEYRKRFQKPKRNYTSFPTQLPQNN